MKYYVSVDDELASRLKEIDDELITEALREVVEENAPPADELMHADLSEAERKRREIDGFDVEAQQLVLGQSTIPNRSRADE